MGEYTPNELEIMFRIAENRIKDEDYKQDYRTARICLYQALPYRKAGELVSIEEFMPKKYVEPVEPHGMTEEEAGNFFEEHNQRLKELGRV